MKTNDEKLQDILKRLEGISYIKPSSIPDIDLYMDQVTTFMDERLQKTKRTPDDKVLTKTMINNYAKNNLIPPPNKKKYSREHMLLLIFIYYFKSLLSFHDIEQLFGMITEHHFDKGDEPSLLKIYEEIFSMEEEEMERLKRDLEAKFDRSKETFSDTEGEEGEYLRQFAFICQLSFDIYLKKQMIESMIDTMRAERPSKKKK